MYFQVDGNECKIKRQNARSLPIDEVLHIYCVGFAVRVRAHYYLRRALTILSRT